MTTRRTYSRRVAIGAGVALLGLLAPVLPAHADPVTDKQAQAAALASQINALGFRESALAEQYDKSVIAEQQAAQQVGAAQQQVAAAGSHVQAARGALSRDAVDAYTHGGPANLIEGASRPLPNAQDGLLRSEYASMLASNQQDALDSFRTAQAEARTSEAQLTNAQQQATARVTSADAARRSVAELQTQLQGTYAQVKGQLAVLVAQVQAAQQAEQARQAQLAEQARQAQLAVDRQRAAQQAQMAAVSTARSGSVQQPSTSPSAPSPAASVAHPSVVMQPATPTAVAANPPAPSGSGGSVAVAAAMTRLGDPYVWGAAGPSSFDCSGLTMWAWAHAGVSLPHYSGSQYASTTHIAMSDLQPGDLVFFADPGEHEAMYIGGGRIIEAPYTGANIRIEPLYSQFVLASRP